MKLWILNFHIEGIFIDELVNNLDGYVLAVTTLRQGNFICEAVSNTIDFAQDFHLG